MGWRPSRESPRSPKLLMPSFTIQPVSDDLFDLIFSLKEQIFRHHIEQIWGWHPDWQHENFSSNWKNCETRSVHSDGAIIGYMQILEEPDHILLKTLGLSPAYQSKGIGSSLVRDLQLRAQLSNLPIKLSVYVTNDRAENFYKSLGFQNEHRDREFQHMIWNPVIPGEQGAGGNE
jgi:ribosomal protein S18 acetylase RimI-like enzyme